MSVIKIKDAAGIIRYMEASGAGTLEDPYKPIHADNETGEQRFPFFRFASEAGDGTGSFNMAVNGSVTPVTFKVKPAPGEIIRIARIITSIRATAAFRAGGWGSQTAPLDNGIDVIWKKNNVFIPLMRDKVKSHYDLSSVSFDTAYHDWGQGDQFLVNRFTFKKAGQYIRLVGDDGDEFQFVINDSLLYLVDQRVSVQGYFE